ncbi:MAG: YggS family pyridoxal phosphate-dependent enzyme [Coraliomargaritaceae bacterium]
MIARDAFEKNLSGIRARMERACLDASRQPDTVELLPVTKNHPADAVRYAVEAGLRGVGENRVQEAAGKRAEFDGGRYWELIGHLQSNKVKEAVEVFDRIQSVDSVKLLRRIDRISGEMGQCLPILLQCNTGEDPRKYGLQSSAVAEAMDLALQLPNVRLDGLMTIAPLDDDADSARSAFRALRLLRDELQERMGYPLPVLSMGMTGDLEAAIAEGSTQIRIGTALFGTRIH